MGLFGRRKKGNDPVSELFSFAPRGRSLTPKEAAEEKERQARERVEYEQRWLKEVASARDVILTQTIQGKEYRGVVLTATSPMSRNAACEAIEQLLAEGILRVRLSRKRRPMYQRV